MVPIVASLIVVGALTLILTDKLNHTIAAVAGAAVMIGVGTGLGFYSEEQALEAIEFEALGLLLGMMILVSILQPSGFFQYAAIKAGQLSRGEPWRLVLLLGAGTALVSLFFNELFEPFWRMAKELRSYGLMNRRLINRVHSERVDYFPAYSSQGF